MNKFPRPFLYLFPIAWGFLAGCSHQTEILDHHDSGYKKVEREFRTWWWSDKAYPILHREYHFNHHKKFEAELKGGKYHGNSKTWWLNGRLRSSGPYRQGQKNGKWKHYFEVRNDLSSRGHYKDGMKHGMWEEWWPKFIRKAKGEYKKGKKTGQWIYWDRIERLEKKSTCFESEKWGSVETFYPSGKKKGVHSCFHGKLAGKFEEFYHPGHLKTLGEYDTSSQKTGWWKSWSEDSILQSKEYFWNGLLKDSAWYYDSTGSLAAHGYFEKGTGELIRYYPSGKILSREYYTQGKKSGTWKTWYPFGALKVEIEYEEDQPLLYKRWFAREGDPFPILALEGKYTQGKRSGIWNWYSKSGKLVERAQYVEGERHGVATFYHPETGKLNRTQHYQRGVETTGTIHR